MDMDARPSKEILDFFRKVESWVERIVYDRNDNRQYIFQDDTPKEVFELLDQIRPELGFDVIIVDE
ncbi:hypothetical protein B8A39_08845 [Dolosigranulum pigrum]|uniref:hypothetical protein n=1 Tax=Dolosigranulum pigrum TaxID=29394 RepID=UPI000DBFE573|nr:hypothetical protein [Dolosigranulum pigrum]RAN50859.1 hypothetical protein B8A39_08845 [Dolosigranulum pigrum]